MRKLSFRDDNTAYVLNKAVRMEEVLLLYKVSAGSIYVAIFEIHRQYREAALNRFDYYSCLA